MLVLIRSRAAGFKGIAVTNWKTDLDALVEETLAFTRSIRAKTVAEPSLLPPIRPEAALRDEIAQRVAQFRAHQQGLIRERENYAEGQLTRMQASLAASGVRRLQTLR